MHPGEAFRIAMPGDDRVVSPWREDDKGYPEQLDDRPSLPVAGDTPAQDRRRDPHPRVSERHGFDPSCDRTVGQGMREVSRNREHGAKVSSTLRRLDPPARAKIPMGTKGIRCETGAVAQL